MHRHKQTYTDRQTDCHNDCSLLLLLHTDTQRDALVNIYTDVKTDTQRTNSDIQLASRQLHHNSS